MYVDTVERTGEEIDDDNNNGCSFFATNVWRNFRQLLRENIDTSVFHQNMIQTQHNTVQYYSIKYETTLHKTNIRTQ